MLSALIWAGSTVVNRLAVGAIEPAAISFYRWLLALFVLSPWLLPKVWRLRCLIHRHFWQLCVLGVQGMALYLSLAYFAAHTVSATSMGLILGTMPLLRPCWRCRGWVYGRAAPSGWAACSRSSA
jgi:drug/metabolite transporter (DMT)-like permease